MVGHLPHHDLARRLAGCVLLALAIPAAGAASDQFQTLITEGSGRVLYATFAKPGSADLVLQRGIKDLASVFDAAPAVSPTKQPRKGIEQAGFTARLKGQEMRGAAMSGVAGDRGWMIVVFDRADASPDDAPALTKQLRLLFAEPQWSREQLLDWSGDISLATGWSIFGVSEGMVDLVGPAGAEAHLGLALQVYTPETAEWTRKSMGFLPKNTPVAAYTDPATATGVLYPTMMALAKKPGGRVEVVEKQEVKVAAAQGKAAFLHIVVHPDAAGGAERQAIVYVQMTPGFGQWTYYVSYVEAPSGVFELQLPTMLKIWQSWKVSDLVFFQRMQLAIDAMTTTHAMMNNTALLRQAWGDVDAAGWDGLIKEGKIGQKKVKIN